MPETRENKHAKSPYGAEGPKEKEIHQFAADYTDHITNVHGARGRLSKAEREDSINWIASLVRQGNLAGIREALGRTIKNQRFSWQSAGLTERLNMMMPKQAPAKENEAAIAPPHPGPDETMPDPAIGVSEMNHYGYQYEGMLPLTKGKALELYDNGQPIYLLYPDNTEAMALGRSEVEAFGGIFGIDRGEWERTVEYMALPSKNSGAAKGLGVVNGNNDMFSIYQLKDIEGLRYHRFASIKQLKAENLAVDRSNYDLVYTAPLPSKVALDEIYEKFNSDPPKGYAGRSLSVSDVVAIQRGGEATSHYVDNFGFVELPAFLGDGRQPEIAAAPTQAGTAEDKPMAQPAAEQRNKAAPPMPDAKNQPVYMKSPGYARDNNELDRYRESSRLNIECASAIDAAILDCAAPGGRGYRLTPEAVSKVIDEYGAHRLCVVLANTVRLSNWDGQYSKDTQGWAKGVELPEARDKGASFSFAHPAVVDGYIRLARKEMGNKEKKPSILDALKQGADRIRQEGPPQKETPTKKKALEAEV